MSRPRRLLVSFLLVAALVASSAAPLQATSRVRKMLPNLVAFAPLDIYVDEDVSGCDPYERIEKGARRCLRYDTIVANFGKGPLELRFNIDQVAREQQMYQRTFRSDGSYSDRVADSYEIHPVHAHVHYANFSVARLWKSNRSAQRLGKKPVRESNKAGFCITDGDNYWEGRPRSTERRYTRPESCYPNDVQAPSVTQIQGLSPGWVDAYPAALSGQYVEITDVADGYYLLEIVIDPLGTLQEISKEDNSVLAFILIRKGRDTKRQVGRCFSGRMPCSLSKKGEWAR